MKFLLFHNAADDSYMNSVENFRGAFAATETVDVYFESPISSAGVPAAYDKITLACTNGEEDRAVEELANAMTRNSSVIVIADDVNSVYACQNITSVTTIAKASAGAAKNIKTMTASGALTAGESGSVVLLNAASLDVTLPAASAGLNYKFILGVDADASNSIQVNSGDCFYGTVTVVSTTADNTEVQHVTRAAALAAPGSYDFLDFEHDVTTIGGKAGDVIEITADSGGGSGAWHVDATLTMDGDPGTIAVINAG